MKPYLLGMITHQYMLSIIKQLRQEGKIPSFKVALYGFYSKSTRRTKKYFYCH